MSSTSRLQPNLLPKMNKIEWKTKQLTERMLPSVETAKRKVTLCGCWPGSGWLAGLGLGWLGNRSRRVQQRGETPTVYRCTTGPVPREGGGAPQVVCGMGGKVRVSWNAERRKVTEETLPARDCLYNLCVTVCNVSQVILITSIVRVYLGHWHLTIKTAFLFW